MERVKKDFLTEGVLRSLIHKAREGSGWDPFFAHARMSDVDWKVR